MKTNTIISATILITVLLIGTSLSVIADPDNGRNGWERPKDKDDKMSGGNRDIMYRIWDDGITVNSIGKDHNKVNAFFFTLKLDKGVFMHYNYFRMPYSDDAKDFHDRISENRSFPDDGKNKPLSPPQGNMNRDELFEDLGFSILMKKLRETNDTDNSISIYRFEDVNFTKPVVDLIKDGSEITGLKIRTETEDGIFGLTFYIVSTAEYGLDRGMTPFEVKYDISIQNYPFQTNDSSIALENIFSLPEMILGEPGERKFDEKPLPDDWTAPSKERTLGIDTDDLSMAFSWATNVTVDDEEHNVTAEYTVSVDGEATLIEKMTFIYPQGLSILHDPKIGVADLLEVAEDATEFIELMISWSTGLGIGVVLIAVVAVRMKPAKFDWEE